MTTNTSKLLLSAAIVFAFGLSADTVANSNTSPIANVGVSAAHVCSISSQAGVQQHSGKNKSITLRPIDVFNIEKLASTEVVPSLKGESFQQQVHGVVDTILNRLASGYWGNNVEAVGNAPWQFSGINSNLKGAYGNLANMPAKSVNQRVKQEVDSYLKARANGLSSSVCDHLNYLNPYYSSNKSLNGWGYEVIDQAKGSGMIFGGGHAVHYHGTSRSLNKFRPGPFRIVLV